MSLLDSFSTYPGPRQQRIAMQTYTILMILCLVVGVMMTYFEPRREQILRESCQICGAGRYQRHHPDCQWKGLDD